jgi:hypothetical protein
LLVYNLSIFSYSIDSVFFIIYIFLRLPLFSFLTSLRDIIDIEEAENFFESKRYIGGDKGELFYGENTWRVILKILIANIIVILS